MNIRFGGITHLTGKPLAVREATKAALTEKPLALYSHVAPGEVILLDGQDSAHFLKNTLNAHLSEKETSYLKDGEFAKVQKDPALREQYEEMLEELQGLAEDAEEQTVPDGGEWKSLSELMQDYYNQRKAQGGKAIDGQPIVEASVDVKVEVKEVVTSPAPVVPVAKAGVSPQAVETYAQRLKGMEESLKNGSLKVVGLSGHPGDLRYIDEASMQVTLDKGGQRFELELAGNMSGRHFRLKSADGLTKYAYGNQCGQVNMSAVDQRPDRAFNFNHEANIHDHGFHAASPEFKALANNAGELRKAFIAAITEFIKNPPPPPLTDVKPDSDF